MNIDPMHEYVLYCDGASRGNPGRAAIGYAIFDADGTEIAAHGEYLGDSLTNNVAEYSSLLHGVDDAHARGIRRLRVRMDSQLVVRQMRGVYKVKHPGLKPLHARALQRVQHFDSFRIEHVRRSDNRRADALANQALDNLISPEK
jgi:ribonuclease HI